MADERSDAGNAGGSHDDLLAQAMFALDNDRAADAVRLAAEVLDADPRHAGALYVLGYALTVQGRYDEAVDVLGRGVEIAPSRPEISIQLGYAQLSRRDCTGARAAFARALDILPEAHDALFGLAKAHQELGENEPAAEGFRRYLTIRPNDAGAWLNLGHCLLELGQLDAGYECFRTAARGDAARYGTALTSLSAASRGRFWLRPSDAARFMQPSRSRD
jgi:tetratricopeptide (TPR) repeat protein